MARNFLRVATCVPRLYVGNPEKNLTELKGALDLIIKKENDIRLIVFPELSVTGYTCGDLFLTEDLLLSSKECVEALANNVPRNTAVIVGCPVPSKNGKLYNCAVVIVKTSSWDKDIYVIPKKHLPEYSEFYEKRWFSDDIDDFDPLYWKALVPGVFSIENIRVGVEICEDLWVPCPPCDELVTKYGANVIVNISASPGLAGKQEYLNTLLSVTSGKLICGYIYVSSGPWESTTDLVFSGYSGIYENGKKISEFKSDLKSLSTSEPQYMIQDIDILELLSYRRKCKFKSLSSVNPIKEINLTPISAVERRVVSKLRTYEPYPFLNPVNCPEIVKQQVLGLQRRIIACGGKNCKCIIGVSGGTDSTWALLITYQALVSLGYPITNLIGVTMPCFATSERTKRNSKRLMETLGITMREVNITESVSAHLQEIGHDFKTYDVAFENAQARLRTQTLFDIANMEGGIVIGTGDLSELALGWCTYGADHLSSYNVNVSVPKTLIKDLLSRTTSLILFEGDKRIEMEEIIFDILDTPISPELVPAEKGKEISQISEDTVGPYELHDYFIYNYFRSGMSAIKLLESATLAFKDIYDLETIKKWEIFFFRRLGSQQFKRSCLPDGPKVGSISLSPRGDWRMPSDINMESAIKSLESYGYVTIPELP